MNDFFDQAFKGTLAVLGTILTYMTSSKGMALVTFLYVVLQAAYLARKWYREEKAWMPRRKSK